MTSKKKRYNLRIVKDLWVSVKRINKDRKAFRALKLYKNKRLNEYQFLCFRFEPRKGFSSVATRRLIKNVGKTRLSQALFWKYKDKPIATPLDMVATTLTIANSNTFNSTKTVTEEEKKEINKLRKKLRRHRKKLGLVNMNTAITTPETSLGHAIKVINFGLNDNKRLSRSQRKKIYRKERERKASTREYYRQRRINATQKEAEKDKRSSERKKLFVEKQEFKNLHKQKREAALFVSTLKKIQKYYPNENEHLDILFKILGYGS